MVGRGSSQNVFSDCICFRVRMIYGGGSKSCLSLTLLMGVSRPIGACMEGDQQVREAIE